MPEEARRIVGCWVQEYNDARVQSRSAYVIPKDWMGRCDQAIGLVILEIL